MLFFSKFFGVKQSAGDLKLFADLMADVPQDKLVFSAVDALMYSSYTLGAHGYIAAILSAAPRPSVELWDAVAAGDHPRAHDLHLKLLRLWNALMPHDKLLRSNAHFVAQFYIEYRCCLDPAVVQPDLCVAVITEHVGAHFFSQLLAG